MDINKSILIGRLVKDAELRYVAGSGTPVINFKIAVNRQSNKNNETKADFIPIILWGKIAESLSAYLIKGKQVAVSGRIQTRDYEKDGVKRYITEVVASDIQLLSPNSNGNSGSNNSNSNSTGFNNSGFNNNGFNSDDMTPIDDGDIPF